VLYCVERVAPLLDGCVAGDLGCNCTVGRKALVEEAEELFKGDERTEEKIAGQEFERLKFKGGRSMVASRRSEGSHLRCP
jgi:hypothetical protein